MTYEEIAQQLAKCDPVYGPITGPKVNIGTAGERNSSIRICALCRARSEHNGENVRHEADCPWILARRLEHIMPEASKGGPDVADW